MTVVAACEWIFGGQSLPAVLARLRDAGCSGVEVAGEPGRADRASIAGDLERSDVPATGITAICPLGAERDLADPEADARRRAVDYYRRCVDLAREIGAPAIGLIPTAVGRVDGDPVSAWPLAVEGARAVADYAGERGVGVGVEAINRYESFLVNRAVQALAFADEVGADNVGVVLDVFHMQLEERDTAAAVAAAAPRLLALHLADSNRLGLGEGQLDFAPLLAAAHDAGYRGPLVFEFTAPGPNPFDADKGAPAMEKLDGYLRASVDAVRAALTTA